MERNKTMKNKHITIVALAAAALATSCASEDIAEPLKQEQNQGEPKTVTLTASVNEAQTRVGMTNDGTTAKFYWHAKDAISVLTKKSDGTFSGTEFTITGDDVKDGATSATFTGEVTGTVGGYAVYPHNASHSFTSATALTYNLPASYTSYTPSTKIFGTSEDYLSTSTNMPMLGTISDNSISFKSLGGLAVIRIDNMPAALGTLTVTANEQLSGDFTIGDLSADEPKIETTTASGDNGKVTFTFSGAAENGVGVFYLPLAVGDYTNLTVEITCGGTTQTVSYGSLSVARKSVTAIPLYNNNGTIVKYIDKSRTINGHKFIDLALPSGLLWAETNVGATNAYDYGTYYNWSDATSWSSSNDCWGTSCSVPTKDNFTELRDYCTYQWTTESGVNGCRVTSAKSGNSIFLPAAGYKQVDVYGDIVISESSKEQGTYGRYWSCTASGSFSSYLGFNSGWFNGGNDNMSRNNKMPVRPVAKP